MAYELKDNSGSLFANDRREKDTQPTHTGRVMVDGREYWLSAWVKEAGGKRFFSLAFKPKDSPNKPAPAPVKTSVPAPAKSLAEELDDEIPF